MIQVQVDPQWFNRFPGARMGLLEVRGLPALSQHPSLDRMRTELEAQLRARHQGQDRKALRELPVMRAFDAHFKPFGKTYHVLLQLESVAIKGRSIPSKLCAVTALFMAELKHGLVAAGHDLDKLAGPLILAPSRGSERYRGFNGSEIELPPGDMTLAHAYGLLSSVLHGPDHATPIQTTTRNVLYTIYQPAGIPNGVLEAQLEDLAKYLRCYAPEARLEAEILPAL